MPDPTPSASSTPAVDPAGDLRRGDFVLVEWLDAATYDGWSPSSEMPTHIAQRALSAGWLERSSPRELVLSSGWSDDINGDREMLSTQAIPRGMVLRVYRPTGFTEVSASGV